MRAIFNWVDDDENDLYKSLIGSSAVLGLAFGSISGGKIISYGRKKAVIISSIIGIIGVGCTMITNISLILIGRLIYGYSTGI